MSGIGRPLSRNVLGEIRSKIHDGRTLNHSVCDVIDNSIDANANNIQIFIEQQSGEIPTQHAGAVVIIDDGDGIPGSDLEHIIEFNAERKGKYQPHELGSFGLGLKDALLAHGSELTVYSKQKGEEWACVRLSMELSRTREEWTYVDHEQIMELCEKWSQGSDELSHWNTPTLNTAIQKIGEMENGTIITLEFSHRPLEVQSDPGEEDELARISVVNSLKEWVGMTFSDYLEGIKIGKREVEHPLSIEINGDPIEPLDPFMKNQIGRGEFEGQQGTLSAGYEFQYDGRLDCKINMYILPNKEQRALRCPGHDDRMKKATRNSIIALQGIYVKRNGRILDGPWNGMWRRSNMGMGFTHHTCARWELVLPPESVEYPELVPPDKSRVSLLGMLSEILSANRFKREWHENDDFSFKGQPSNAMQFNYRARARNQHKDFIEKCREPACELKASASGYCIDHTTSRCRTCDVATDGTDLCDQCLDAICNTHMCERRKVPDSDFCLECGQDPCVIEGCASLQMAVGNFCQEHASMACRFPGCQSISQEGFNRCDLHMKYELDGVIITTKQDGPLIELEEGRININVKHEDFPNLQRFLSDMS